MKQLLVGAEGTPFRQKELDGGLTCALPQPVRVPLQCADVGVLWCVVTSVHHCCQGSGDW